MKKLLIRGGLSLIGLIVTLTWWTYGPRSKQTVPTESHIPGKVGIGGQKLEIEADSSTAATMRVSFNQYDNPSGQQELMDTWEKIPTGLHSWSINVPAGVGGFIELGADHPNVGDKLTMRVRMNGQLVDEQSEVLDKALEPNTAFFVQDEFNDYSQAAKERQPQ